MGANPSLKDKAGNSSLHLLSRTVPDAEEVQDYTDVLGEIVQTADVNSASGVGDTPLHLAAEGGNQIAVDLLLSRGADPNKANKVSDSIVSLAFLRPVCIPTNLPPRLAKLHSMLRELWVTWPPRL